MNRNLNNSGAQYIIICFAAISIAVIAFLTYRDILGYFFTGLDTFNIIEESRFQSIGEFLRLFKKTMTEEFAWYRPVAVSFYGLDYLIWNLNPAGYFLTNLILHIVASVLVFFFARYLLDGNNFTAWLIAIVFTIHPIHVENVPALRMNDIIATLFVLVSLLFFMKHFNSLPRLKSSLLFSLFFYVLALGSKEIAIILPVLVFSYSVIFTLHDKYSLKKIALKSGRTCLPYIAITVFYLIWRSYIVHGIGGYTSSFGRGTSAIIDIIRRLINISILYFKDLIYPVDFLRLDYLFNPNPTIIKQAGFTLILLGLGISLIIYFRKQGNTLIHNNDKSIIRVSRGFLLAIAIISLIGIMAYPVLSPHINKQIQHAYNGEGSVFIASQMDNAGRYPVEFYKYKTREFILNSSLAVLAVSVILLIIINGRITLKQTIIHSVSGKVKGFLLVWLLLPFFIYMATVTFDHHDMYISIVPLSTILCILFVEAFNSVRQRRELFKFIAISAIVASFIAYSPLVRAYGEWKASGEVQKVFLEKLSSIILELPDNTVIHIYNFPGGIASFKKEIPHAKEVAYYADFSIKAWLDMNYPDNRINVVMHGKKEIPVYPESLELDVKYGEGNNVNIYLVYEG